jgi:predicted RNA binding protein YcfA (HicA-like mRNA interferase family)
MPKLGVFSGADVCDILRTKGFELVRQRGSHLIMQRRAGETTITVPVPNHREIRIGTLQSIIRQSQLPRDLFMR